MSDKTKSDINNQNSIPFVYSQPPLNKPVNAEDNEYNLYCFSQGYKNHEKGYWRGVLRNKNVDFDLRFNKEWNRRIELENDDIDGTEFASSKMAKENLREEIKEYISFLNENEVGWENGRFEKFQKQQNSAGIKKEKKKEWILSNGIKRNAKTIELRTKNYKQFEEIEKNKEIKKPIVSSQVKTQEKNSSYQNETNSKLYKDIISPTDTHNTNNTYNTVSSNGYNQETRKWNVTTKKEGRIESNQVWTKTEESASEKSKEYGNKREKTADYKTIKVKEKTIIKDTQYTNQNKPYYQQL